VSVDIGAYLARATSRAKSDVANKLVSMALHLISREICKRYGLSVTDQAYRDMVVETFGSRCPYCDREIVRTSCVVEHLNGMNRFRVGLHIPSNVLVACSECNKEKRRDDQVVRLKLADHGWSEFLSHKGTQDCLPECRSCGYWKRIIPDDGQRQALLSASESRIREFVNKPEFALFQSMAISCHDTLKEMIGRIYRDGQEFATNSMLESREKIEEILKSSNSGDQSVDSGR